MISFLIGEPDSLEGAVTLHRAGHVVINAFARPCEQARRSVVLVHDQVGIGLVALQRDADNHLAHRCSSQSVGAAESLGAEEYVNAKGAALPHDSIKQNVGRLRNTIVFDEELLELVDDQQAARNRFGAAGFFVASHVLDTKSPE